MAQNIYLPNVKRNLSPIRSDGNSNTQHAASAAFLYANVAHEYDAYSSKTRVSPNIFEVKVPYIKYKFYFIYFEPKTALSNNNKNCNFPSFLDTEKPK